MTLHTATVPNPAWHAPAAVRTLLARIVRHQRRLIWEADLTQSRAASEWEPGERVLMLGPENLDSQLSPALYAFLGGGTAAGEIEGVRRGDRLFLVAQDDSWLACSYIFFATTSATRRQMCILGEGSGTPVIGMSYTAPAARGRGLYRRLLNDMFRALAAMGYRRAVCEVDPRNQASNKASQAAGMRVCRELSDWIVLDRLLLQRVRSDGRTAWRLCATPRHQEM